MKSLEKQINSKNIIIFPCSSKEAKENYENTIQNKISKNEIKKYKTDINVQNDYFSVWGLRDSDKLSNIYNKIKKGDVVVFYKNKHFFSWAKVVEKFENEELANKLWKSDKHQETWSNIILLKKITNFKSEINVENFNKIMHYKNNNIIQGCMILENKQRNKINDLFKEIYEKKNKNNQEEVNEKKYEDFKVWKTVRAEQKDLRDYLFKDKVHELCGICGQEFEIKHLVAAHIKKREKCSNEEKKDIKNIAMPMCLYGCDTSFEKGEILINTQGKIEINLKCSNPSKETKKYLNKLDKRKIINYNDKNAKYFKFHFDFWKNK